MLRVCTAYVPFSVYVLLHRLWVYQGKANGGSTSSGERNVLRRGSWSGLRRTFVWPPTALDRFVFKASEAFSKTVLRGFGGCF